MADDPQGGSGTEGLPLARDAFLSDERAIDARRANAITRAAALLSLFPPPGQREMDEYEALTEARALGVSSVGRFEFEKDMSADVLEDMGELGQRAALLLRLPRAERPRGLFQLFAANLDRPSSHSDETQEPVRALQRESASIVYASEAGFGAPARREAAARLTLASLLDEHPLVRVAAASASLWCDQNNFVAEAILDRRGREDDEIAELARAGLASARRNPIRRVELESGGLGGSPPRLPPTRGGDGDDGGEGGDRPASTMPGSGGLPDSALVHGTWARGGRWWQPGGGFHTYLRETAIFPHLFAESSEFEWSGYFSFRNWFGASVDWDRVQAGSHLAWWAERCLAHSPDFIGHSYGASISMLATSVEKHCRGLVLLSPAVHKTCLPTPEYYEQILTVRMNFDLVLLADRSRPELLTRLPRVEERVIPRRGLVGHAATHDPDVWRAERLGDYVRESWLPLLGDRG
jgi:hypothetical protein